MFPFPSLAGFIVVKSRQSRSNGLLATKDPCFTSGSLYGPLAFLHFLHVFTQLVTSSHIVLQKYTLSFGELAHCGATVVLGSYKLEVKLIDGTWNSKSLKWWRYFHTCLDFTFWISDNFRFLSAFTYCTTWLMSRSDCYAFIISDDSIFSQYFNYTGVQF